MCNILKFPDRRKPVRFLSREEIAAAQLAGAGEALKEIAAKGIEVSAALRELFTGE